MKPWGYHHPVLTWSLVAISVLFFLTGETAGVILGLIGVGLAYQLFGRPGFGAREQTKTRRPETQIGQEARIISSPSGTRRTPARSVPAAAQALMNALPTPSRIALVNHLELDEEPEFILVGASSDALIGTDSRIFAIPGGRNGHERMSAVPYGMITNVRIDQQRSGKQLVISTQQSPSINLIIRLIDNSQVEAGITVVHEIKRRIAIARQTQVEDASPSGHSSFNETAHTTIPTGRQRSSLSLQEMLEMSPTEFEEYTGRALESLGYSNVKRVGGSGDLAADLTATDPQGRSAIVQCKRYSPGSKVGSPAIQAFIGMKSVHHKADRGIFVTTADYTQQAIALAKEHDIVLIDGDDLVKIAALVLTPTWIPETGPIIGSAQYCAECGAKMREGAKFCNNCGTKVIAPTN